MIVEKLILKQLPKTNSAGCKKVSLNSHPERQKRLFSLELHIENKTDQPWIFYKTDGKMKEKVIQIIIF